MTAPSKPPPFIRLVGRVIVESVARAPFLWPLMRGFVRRFFDREAAGWGARVRPAKLELLAEAIEGLQPRRILEVGAGTGDGARWLAQRYPEATVLAIDLSPEMIAHAHGAERVEFRAADAADVDAAEFDLVVHLNAPVFFASLRGARAVVVVATFGPATPFYTSHRALRRGFARIGLPQIAEGRIGEGTWLRATP